MGGRPASASRSRRRRIPRTHLCRSVACLVAALVCLSPCVQKQSIFLAVQEGDAAKVSVLLAQLGPDGDLGFTQAPQGNTPLHVACICGHIQVTRILLNHGSDTGNGTGGCDANVRDAEGRTPLYVAAMGGHLEIVQLLLEDRSPSPSPARSGSSSSSAAAVNLRTAAGLNALYAACWRGHRDVALALLAAGSDLADVTDAQGRHAWTIAREWNHTALADEIEAHAMRIRGINTTGATTSSSSIDGSSNGNAPASAGIIASSGNASAAAIHPRAADDGL